ncbi:tRNA (adenine-N(1))-methyltransferase [Listeria aquatica]|uniref:tRNA (Adenine-N(1))-methyltransferase n=1 Tax=Listeria aquatica TaxID=1494960 RepID=A0A841ZJI1_9LIST|nr:tRNA (adenine(22)-N(1))-methyltransferase TrmK [Listeria aquatica]MBC1520839.1 tRNA (adenine-N(1))-methyltransferase [Listeria aquatica]
MNEQKLSKRLEKVAHFIEPQSRIADIGSDHAYLPCYAVLKGFASFAIAGEIADGPFRSAQDQVEKTGLLAQISVRKGDGLEVLELSDEVDTVVIAGMGGPLIANILENGKRKLARVKRLILQPNIAAKRIREWGAREQFQITAEEIIEEDHKIYEILVLERSNEPVDYSEDELFFGPMLLKEKNAIFRTKWQHERDTWKKITENIEKQGKTLENEAKLAELHAQIKRVEDVLK